ncbi:MAG: hypothetical protein DSZ29_01800 [Aquificaceae bacterium]|nr:MAG: hypothetical protein DSZ29_01800 [Aquificaceae bacterium]
MTSSTFKLNLFLLIFFCASFIAPTSLQAKTIVLIHGYLANGNSWRTTQATRGLLAAGWKDGGNYSYSPQGMKPAENPIAIPDAFYTVDLPSKAPIEVQARILGQYLDHLYAIRDEPIIFIGHSAGGIVARLYLVTLGHVPARALITIGTPHLGTAVANLALLAGNSPLGMMLDMAGQDDITDSRGLYADLKEAKPNTFLYWLNQQIHPKIPYVSVIRVNPSKRKLTHYDFIVPSESQNMNNVWALRGQSMVYLTPEGHFLSDKDGLFIVDILKRIIK